MHPGRESSGNAPLGIGAPSMVELSGAPMFSQLILNFCSACSAAMVMGSALGSEEMSGLQADVKVVSSPIVRLPRMKALTASISLEGPMV